MLNDCIIQKSDTEDVFNGVSSRIARKTCPQALSGDRINVISIRINEQYRICFKWSEAGPFDVEITDYHWEVINMVSVPTDRVPTHPGEMLLEEFLTPMNITQRELADAIHVPYQRVNELVNQKRGITPSTALRLARFFNVSADFWLNLQLRCDLYKAQKAESKELESINAFHHLQKTA